MAKQELKTRAEATHYQETSRHSDVLAFCDALAAQSKLVHRTTLGKSGEGQDMVALVLSDRQAFTPEKARRQKKAVVLIEANIHAGEVEGKEEVLALARDLALSKSPILSKICLLIVPNFNPDGNDRISPNNRALNLAQLEGQVNPPGGVGTRYTGEGWNLNRDNMKQEAIETRNMARFYQHWWPELFIDCHTTDGSLHQYDLTYDCPRGNEHLFPDVRAFNRRMLDDIAKSLKGVKSFWYGNFVEETKPESGWHTYPALPRFGSHYRGLLGRLDVLLETYSYLSFERRCEVIGAWLKALVTYAARNSSKLIEVARAADASALSNIALVSLGHGVAKRDSEGALAFDYPAFMAPGDVATIESFDLPSLEARRYPGKKRVRYKVPHLRTFVPTTSARLPSGYLVPAQLAQRLSDHGIKFEAIPQAATFDTESYLVLARDQTFSPDVAAAVPAPGQSEVPLSAKPPPVRFETVLTVRAEKRQLTLPKGTLYVPAKQRAFVLAAYLLEPHSDDGFARWQFLDPLVKVGELFPVHRLLAS